MSDENKLKEDEKQHPVWILHHPVFQQMNSLDVEDSSQIYAAFLVYMDLTEVRHWTQVSCVKSADLQLVLLQGQEKEDSCIQTVLPLPSHRTLSHESIRHVLDRGHPMLLCAVASDSTLVYQRMTDGLVTPDPPVGPFQDAERRRIRKRRQQV